MIVGGQRIEVPFEVQTWEDGAHHFHAASTPVAREWILHETGGAGDPVPTLVRRKLGVEFVVMPDGRIRQHADLLANVQHIGHRNPWSIGVEVVNPYYPSQLPKNGPWEHVIEATWSHALPGKPRGYVLPTPAQAEAVTDLTRWMTARPAPGIEVDWYWPGYARGSFAFVALGQGPASGVWSHHHVGGHTDGAWLALYTFLRLVCELEAPQAYDAAKERARAVRGGRVDVRDLVGDRVVSIRNG